MKTSLARLMAFCALGAARVSLEKIYCPDRLEKQKVMTTVLHSIYSRYSRDPATSYKATHMLDLSNPAVAGDDPKLLALIMQNTVIAHRWNEQSRG